MNSIKCADNNIKDLLEIYKQQKNLLETDGKEKDTSIYYNWLEENLKYIDKLTFMFYNTFNGRTIKLLKL